MKRGIIFETDSTGWATPLNVIRLTEFWQVVHYPRWTENEEKATHRQEMHAGRTGPLEVKINWFVAVVLRLNANSFVLFVMCTFKFCHLGVMQGLLTWLTKTNTAKDGETEKYNTAFSHVSGWLLDLNVHSSNLNLIKSIIKRTKSFLTHMNRIAKLPTSANTISISYQTQLNSITGGRKVKDWNKYLEYICQIFREANLPGNISDISCITTFRLLKR